MTRGLKQEVKCKRCKAPFLARVADIKRGWGKYCSKSCKAVIQEKRTGQFRDYLSNIDNDNNNGGCLSVEEYHNSIHPFSEEAGW